MTHCLSFTLACTGIQKMILLSHLLQLAEGDINKSWANHPLEFVAVVVNVLNAASYSLLVPLRKEFRVRNYGCFRCCHQ